VSIASDAIIGGVLAASRYVLLDFDGPVCSIFAGRAAHFVAEDHASQIRSLGVTVPAEVLRRGDPLDVLRYSAQLGEPTVTMTEHSLQAAELAAAETATPAPGADEFLDACRLSDRPVALVSNNSAPAIARYLERTGLAGYVTHIEGRDPSDPALMKPHPSSVQRAVHAIGGHAEASVLIGDSSTDLAAATAAAIRSIGYASRPAKVRALTEAGAAGLVTRMTDLARLTATTPVTPSQASPRSAHLGEDTT